MSCALQVVITVFAETNALSPVPASVAQDSDTEDGEGPTLTFNLYCSKLSQSVDIGLPDAMQKMMTGEMLFAERLRVDVRTGEWRMIHMPQQQCLFVCKVCFKRSQCSENSVCRLAYMTPPETTPSPRHPKGRSIIHFPKGEARSSAIRRSARFLCITATPSSEGLQAEV